MLQQSVFFLILLLIPFPCSADFIGIFSDISDQKFVDDAYVLQDGVFLPNASYTQEDRAQGYIEIIGWKNAVKIAGTQYVKGDPLEAVIISHDAKKYSSGKWSWWNCGIDWIKEDVRKEVNNGVLTVYLDVSMKWHEHEYNSFLGRRRTFYHHDYATFSDSAIIPQVYPDLADRSAQVRAYTGELNPHAVVKPPDSTGLVKTTYHYNGENVTHYHLIGVQERTEKSVEYVNLSNWDHWQMQDSENISRRGNVVYLDGEFNASSFSIVVSDPYETATLKNLSVEYIETSGPYGNWKAIFLFLSLLSIFCIFHLKIWRCIF